MTSFIFPVNLNLLNWVKYHWTTSPFPEITRTWQNPFNICIQDLQEARWPHGLKSVYSSPDHDRTLVNYT